MKQNKLAVEVNKRLLFEEPEEDATGTPTTSKMLTASCRNDDGIDRPKLEATNGSRGR